MALACAGTGGLVWYSTRCNVRDYFHLASASPLNRQDQYLFACGYIWHSVDGGRLWARQSAHGIPFGTRDGYITVDRRSNLLYLGILINSRSSIHCLECAWTHPRPAIFTSADGGWTWSLAYQFRRGPAGHSGFLTLLADPSRDGAAWAVIQNDDEINYYATGTSGLFWKQICTEYYFLGSGGCDLPGNVLEFQRPERGDSVGQ
jgi:hypothetical protein